MKWPSGLYAKVLNAWFTTEPLKDLSDQVWIIYRYIYNFENWKFLIISLQNWLAHFYCRKTFRYYQNLTLFKLEKRPCSSHYWSDLIQYIHFWRYSSSITITITITITYMNIFMELFFLHQESSIAQSCKRFPGYHCESGQKVTWNYAYHTFKIKGYLE